MSEVPLDLARMIQLPSYLKLQTGSRIYSMVVSLNLSIRVFTAHLSGVRKHYEPRCDKTGIQGFQPDPPQTRLYNHTMWLET